MPVLFTYLYNMKGGEKLNSDSIVDNLAIKCLTSVDNKFSLDEDGNLTVNSITATSGIPTLDIDLIYPIGSIYMNTSSIDPGAIFGGTWEKIEDRFLLASGNTYSNGTIGGEATHLLTQAESGLREHTHQMRLSTTAGVGTYSDMAYRAISGGSIDEEFRTGRVTAVNSMQNDYGAVFIDGTDSANAMSAHNNMPPYLVVNIWKRIS